MILLRVIGLAVCGIILYLSREAFADHKIQRQEMLTESILREAEIVLMDFLDNGRMISIATEGKYRGTVSFRLQSRGDGTKGFCISMYDCGDLRQVGDPVLEKLQLNGFVRKYGYAYDQNRDSIRYQTTRNVKLQHRDKTEWEQLLSRRIRNHPLALMKSDTVICTRGI